MRVGQPERRADQRKVDRYVGGPVELERVLEGRVAGQRPRTSRAMPAPTCAHRSVSGWRVLLGDLDGLRDAALRLVELPELGQSQHQVAAREDRGQHGKPR